MPAGFSLVNEIADLLEISIDSAYRRLRCETEFSLNEIVLLCNKFGLSFDSFCQLSTGSVHFQYALQGNSTDSYLQYLININKGLQNLKEARDHVIFYAAEDIPLFFLFAIPELAWFKSYYWMRSVLNVPEYQQQSFEDAEIPKDIMETGKEILSAYRMIPSIEIWSEQTVSSMLKQIDFYHESGFFADSITAVHLLNRLSELIISLKNMAEMSSKSPENGPGNNFTLYHCDIEIGNNCILAKSGSNQRVYLRHSTFNTIESSDTVFCNETMQWINGLVRKSTQISGVAEKQRNRFFQNLLNMVKKQIDAMS